ncbi:MAG: hypothetical protein K6A94_06720 [Bacteroidales bacterium]|nr:hypothetical protein [Bacteroidales bacterium]
MDTMDYQEMVRDARRELEREQERLTEKMEQLDARLRLMDGIDRLLTENQELKDEIEALQQQLTEEKKRNADLEMKLAEMGKLSAGVAKKASEEAMLKALRTFVNRSKRKTLDKRAFAKTATLEIANANGLTLPEDLAITIDSLDDEQADPKTVSVTVNGNYNDIHDNGGVTLNRK